MCLGLQKWLNLLQNHLLQSPLLTSIAFDKLVCVSLFLFSFVFCVHCYTTGEGDVVVLIKNYRYNVLLFVEFIRVGII